MLKKGTKNTLTIWNHLISAVAMLALIMGNLAPTVNVAAQTTAQTAAPAVAATNTLTLSVVSAADSSPIANFKYIINVDNTGTTTQRSPAVGCSPANAGYPDSCDWVSVAGRASNSPIYTQGDQSDFGPGLVLPDGRYLISVLADGYKIDGEHFTVPLTDPGLVTVRMQPYDLPDATVRAFIFEDNAPTNSAPDAPAEPGLAGFVGHIKDYIDEVTTDIYGNPLCTRYEGEDPVTFTGATLDVDGAPIPIPGTGGQCVSDANGMLAIPHLGPNRYALSAVPPNGSDWVQTTTLEGNHDWDAWVMEGATGYDTEFVVAGEPFPATFFGFVHSSVNTMAAGSGTITGIALAVSAYIPPVGGIGGEPGLLGAKPKNKNPIETLYVSLSDINNGDQTVFVGQFDCNAACDPVHFTIPGVPDGDYVLGIWDEPQDYIFGIQNVSVRNGETVDLGSISLLGWWTTIEGHVFSDDNENGKMDLGEAGIPNFPIVMRTRENSIMDRGTVAITTDASGYYWMESAYPMTQWLVEEAYADGFHTTGITYQADNQPEETTILGAGVDVNVHPVIGLGGRLDWGVKAYAPGTNGGIVGTISYDTTRNELNPQYAAIEDWQPSIAGLTVNLYAPVDCPYDVDGNPTAPCDVQGFYLLNADGSYARGNLLNQYISETWERPSGCVARNVNGEALIHGTDENVLPLAADAPCLEAPMMGVQFGPMAGDVGTPDENFGASVDGNYGFGDGCFSPGGFDPSTGGCVDGSAPTPLPSNMDYLVQVEIPNDALGRPMYKVTREEDINIANGDSFVPQVPPPACAGPLHTVDVTGGTDNYLDVVGAGYDVNGLPVGVTVPASTPTDNPTFVDIGGSVYEGQQKPLCDTKLVRLSDRKSIAPGFNLFTDVPIPGRFWGLIVDDLNFSSDPQSLGYGEKMGLSFAPVGIYDYTNRLITTVESDYNGLFDVLLPSTNRISCPTPSGVCANLYRFVGNDPGVPGRLNLNYNPLYRTIAAEFEAFPGLTIPADLAPTQVAVGVQIPGSQTLSPVACTLDAATPQLYAINKPYIYVNEIVGLPTFTLTGLGFGAAQGAGSVRLGSTAMTIVSWSNTQIQFRLPTSGIGPNPYRLSITANNGQSSVNGLTFHVINPGGGGGGGTYNPTLFIVSDTVSNPDPAHAPGRWFRPTVYTDGNPSHAIQNAIDAASGLQRALIVIYPNTPQSDRVNPRGAYYENLVIHSPVKLQGVGPGSPDGSVLGSIVDGSAFGGDTVLADDWRTTVGNLFVTDPGTGELVPGWEGNPTISEGQTIYLLAETQTQFGSTYRAAIDGLDIRGGDQQGFPGNLNAIFGGYPGPAQAINVETQGGAIFANAYIRNLQITNNVIENNGGSYGAIRIGTPNLATPDNQNDNLRIANNRILANGGTNLAGAIGLFNGSDGYEIDHNDLCGNFSAEYGGAISHFGRSNTGSVAHSNGGTPTPVNEIHDNRIYFNRSYDEGAGIMIAGELPVDPAANYGTPNGAQGSGAVNIFNNLVQANLGDDDGGGIRFLMAGNFPMNVYNNMIVNNISTHEGGGIALDDAPNVRFYNNTVMKNVTTATSITSDGDPAPAGLSTGQNSAQLQATLPGGSPAFSNPLLFNNIFWDNRAGTRGLNNVTGITPADTNDWDMGVFGFPAGSLAPTNSVVQQNAGTYPYTTSPTNSAANPAVVDDTLEIPLTFTSWRTNVNFTGAIMVTAGMPPTLMGNYHLSGGSSPAYNLGAASITVPSYQQPPASLAAPAFDIDTQTRPALGGFDSGADEYPGPQADLSVTKDDGVVNVDPGVTLHYTIVVTNFGPAGVALAPVTDTVPAALTGVTWTCAASAGSSCAAAGGSGSINTTVDLPVGGTATFTLNGTVAANATGALANTASVAAPGGTTDPSPGNNSATDSDLINLPFPNLGVLDNFNRATLGGNWSTPSTGYVINTNVLRVTSTVGLIKWTSTYGPNQEAYFTFTDVSTVASEQDLVLKVNPTNTNSLSWTSMIEALYDRANSQVRIETFDQTNNWVIRATFTGVTFANGDQFGARALQDGTVNVYKNGVLIGTTNITSGPNPYPLALAQGGGKIGVWFIGGNNTAAGDARIDNFGGGTITPALLGFSLAGQQGQLFLPLITH